MTTCVTSPVRAFCAVLALCALVVCGCALGEIVIGEHKVGVIAAASRMTHTNLGACDVPISIDPEAPSTESRLLRAGDPVTLAFQFNRALSPTSDAQGVLVSHGSVSSLVIESHRSTLTIEEVPNAVTLVVDMRGLTDEDGYLLRGNAVLSVFMRTGDVNESGSVDMDDVQEVKALDGSPIDSDDCETDLNRDGKMDLIDEAVAINFAGGEDG